MIKKGETLQKQPIQNEPPTSENGNPTRPNTTQQNNLELTLSTKTKVNSKKLKENFKQWKYHFTITKKHWMENS